MAKILTPEELAALLLPVGGQDAVTSLELLVRMNSRAKVRIASLMELADYWKSLADYRDKHIFKLQDLIAELCSLDSPEPANPVPSKTANVLSGLLNESLTSVLDHPWSYRVINGLICEPCPVEPVPEKYPHHWKEPEGLSKDAETVSTEREAD